MKVFTLLCLILPSVCFSFPFLPQPSTSISQAKSEILAFRLNEAARILRSESDPAQQPFAEFYLLCIRFLKIYSTYDLLEWEAFDEISRAFLDKTDENYSSDPYRMFLLGEMCFLRSILNFQFKKYLTAGIEMKKAYDYLSECKSRFPLFYESYKTLGLIHSIIGSLPEKYRWALNLAGMEGSLSEGKRELELAVEKSSFVPDESKILFSYLNLYFYNDRDKAFSVIQEIHNRYPESPLISFFYISLCLKHYKNDLAFDAFLKLEKIRKDTAFFEIPFLDYYQGEIFFRKNEFMSAFYRYNSFSLRSQGYNFRKTACLKAGLCLELSGNRSRALDFYGRTTHLPDSETEEDKYSHKLALIYLDRPLTSFEQKSRVARNYFDGGYFSSCENALKEIRKRFLNTKKLSTQEQTELFYRFARLYDEMGKDEEAFREYDKCSADQVGPDFLWMVVYSLYYRARILEKQKKFKEAFNLYKTSLSFSGYDFQTGLEHLSKAGLQRVKNLF